MRFNPDDPNTVVPWYDASAARVIDLSTANRLGTFWYVCKNHPSQMRGRINVTACNWTELGVYPNNNTTGGTDLVQMSNILIDPNDFYNPIIQLLSIQEIQI